MKYLLDTANLESISRYTEVFPIAGITSNPSIVKKEGKIDFFAHMNKIRSVIGKEKSFHIQVTAQDTQGMLRDADAILSRVDDQVYIKVPVTMDGIKAIKLLKSRNLHVTATAVYSKQQAFLALEAGADFIAPYFNRMENMGINPDDVIASIADMISQYKYSTTILGASFKNAGQVDRAFEAGAQAVTVDPSILVGALTQPHILDAIKVFDEDWKSVYGSSVIAEL